MKKAAPHPQEAKRVEALESLGILDTLPEKDYDDIAMIAAQICGTPVALISLVDNHRQWFKAKKGVDVTECSKEIAFCAHAVLQEDIFLVEDALKDERFHDNPLVSGPMSVRFYAGAPLLSPDGYPIGTVCVIDRVPRSLNEQQKSALKALSNQVRRLLELKTHLNQSNLVRKKLEIKKTVMDNISDGVVLQDHTGAIIDFNPAAMNMFGMTPGEMYGAKSVDSKWNVIMDPSERPAVKALRTGKDQRNVSVVIQNADGDKRWLRVNSVPLNFENSEKPSHVVSSFSDVTQLKNLEDERRNLEAQLMESARLTSLGEMSSGLAHEINNPLTIINGKINLLMRKFASKGLSLEEDMKHFESIENTVIRIAKIIKGLRSCSRDASQDPTEVIPFQQVIENTLEMCREKFRQSGIEVRVHCEPSVRIECRVSQISQVLLNLLFNSFDAVAELPEKWVNINVFEEIGGIKVLITDSGRGISSAIAKKIMEPFFTTKGPGKGVGLGLTIGSGIAEGHGGSLKYDSDATHTTFVLLLPKDQNHRSQKAG